MGILASWLTSAGAYAADPRPPETPAQTIDEIIVSARKLNVESKIDRKVYTVADDAQGVFGSASDILSVIPSVDVDLDGMVSLRGDRNVLVLIDGEPSTKFQGSAAGDNLQSLSATDIERVEILTTPPPEFKAEGAAGVINIITRKRRPPATAGTVQASAGSAGRYVGAVSLSHAGQKGSVSISAGFRQDHRDRKVSSEIVGPDPVSRQVLDSRGGFVESLSRQVPSFGVSGAYAIDEKQSVSGSASWTRRGGLRTYVQHNSSADATGLLTSSTGRRSSGHDPEDDYDTVLRLSKKLSHPGESLELSVHRSISHQHERYDYANESFVPPEPLAFSNLSFTEDHGIAEAGADYVLPLGKTRTLKLGYSFERDDYGFNNVGATVDPTSGVQSVDPTLTNDFRFHQNIHAIYGSYQAVVGPWTGLGGLRAEWTRNDALLVTNGTRTQQQHFELFPSLHVDRPVSDNTTLSFGASRRITRPQPESLNPYLDHEYTPNLNAGNQDLRPQITQSFDLGLEYDRRGAAFLLSGYYRRNKDSVTDVIQYLGNGYSLATKENLPRNDSAGAEFTATGHAGSRLNYSISGNIFYSEVDATQLGTPGLRSTTGVNLKAKFDFHPTAKDSAQLTFTRTDKRLTPQGIISAINLVNLGYKRAVSSAFTMVATVSDLFNGQRFTRVVSSPDVTQTYRRAVAGRFVYVGLVYTFGTKKDKQANFDYVQGE
jgi:outer membrane receptor protein involved in Fe transport